MYVYRPMPHRTFQPPSLSRKVSTAGTTGTSPASVVRLPVTNGWSNLGRAMLLPGSVRGPQQASVSGASVWFSDTGASVVDDGHGA